MGTAYTPGLTVTSNTIVRKTRKLPIKGTVLVNVGDRVEPDSTVARADLPGDLDQIKVAHMLGANPAEVPGKMLFKLGDRVEQGQVIARTTYFFGWFKSEAKAPSTGTIEYISDVSGNVGVRLPPRPVELTAYVQGTVVEVIPDEGVVIETPAALVQGIFGIGGEREGRLHVMPEPDRTIEERDITKELAGRIIIGRRLITGAALRRAGQTGVVGVVVGGIVDKELVDLLGYEIGVAITGDEQVGVTLVLTEGFGEIEMAHKTFELLRSLEGRDGSINGATQIRAGVIRPEVIVPHPGSASDATVAVGGGELKIGSHIRVIREPNFGHLGTVTALPHELVLIETGAKVRVLRADLDSGEAVVVPRANVELL
ncbi:MAG: hypothetical protein JW889_05730 [Verrucomicrobia bacterium]|nr:hypothetical protein [Verrucomicrobiota bacterium]